MRHGVAWMCLGALGACQVSWEKLTVPMLKSRLRQQGLPVSGRKAQLLERLREHHAERAQQAAHAEQGEHGESELSGLTVVALRRRLKERGLPVSGRKVELIARLKEPSPQQLDLSVLPCPQSTAPWSQQALETHVNRRTVCVNYNIWIHRK